jgi:hypothetical protein
MFLCLFVFVGNSQEAYREWACAMITDTLEDGQLDCETKLMPCPSCASICHQVMRLCPYLSPDRNQADRKGQITPQTSQYGGHPAFYCPLENDDPSDPAYTSLCFHQSPSSSPDPDYTHNICTNPRIHHHQDPLSNDDHQSQEEDSLHHLYNTKNGHPIGNNNNAKASSSYHNNYGSKGKRFSRHAKSSGGHNHHKDFYSNKGTQEEQVQWNGRRNNKNNDDNKPNNVNYNYYSDSDSSSGSSSSSTRNNVNYFNDRAEYNSGENFNSYDIGGGGFGGGISSGSDNNGAFTYGDEAEEEEVWSSETIPHYTSCCWTYASSVVHFVKSQTFPEYGSDRYFTITDAGTLNHEDVPVDSLESSTTTTIASTTASSSVTHSNSRSRTTISGGGGRSSSTPTTTVTTSRTFSKSSSKNTDNSSLSIIGSGSPWAATTPVNKKPSSVSDNRVILNCCDSRGACNSRFPQDVLEGTDEESSNGFSSTPSPHHEDDEDDGDDGDQSHHHLYQKQHHPQPSNLRAGPPPLEIEIGQPKTTNNQYKSSTKRSSDTITSSKAESDASFYFHPDENSKQIRGESGGGGGVGSEGSSSSVGATSRGGGVQAFDLKADAVHLMRPEDEFLRQTDEDNVLHREILREEADSLPNPTHIPPGLDYDEHYIDTEPDGDGGSSSTELEDDDVFEPNSGSTTTEWEKGAVATAAKSKNPSSPIRSSSHSSSDSKLFLTNHPYSSLNAFNDNPSSTSSNNNNILPSLQKDSSLLSPHHYGTKIDPVTFTNNEEDRRRGNHRGNTVHGTSSIKSPTSNAEVIHASSVTGESRIGESDDDATPVGVSIGERSISSTSVHERRDTFMEFVIGDEGDVSGVGGDESNSKRHNDADRHHARSASIDDDDTSSPDVILIEDPSSSPSDLHFLSFDNEDNNDNNGRYGSIMSDGGGGSDGESSGGGLSSSSRSSSSALHHPYSSKAQDREEPSPYFPYHEGGNSQMQRASNIPAKSSGSSLLHSSSWRKSSNSNRRKLLLPSVFFHSQNGPLDHHFMSSLSSNSDHFPFWNTVRTFIVNCWIRSVTDCCHLFVMFMITLLCLMLTNFLPVLLLNLEDEVSRESKDKGVLPSHYNHLSSDSTESSHISSNPKGMLLLPAPSKSFKSSNDDDTADSSGERQKSSSTYNFHCKCPSTCSSNDLYRHSRRNEDERVKKAVVLQTEDNHDIATNYNYDDSRHYRYYDDIRDKGRFEQGSYRNGHYYRYKVNDKTSTVFYKSLDLDNYHYCYSDTNFKTNTNNYFNDIRSNICKMSHLKRNVSSRENRNLPRRRTYLMNYYYCYYYCNYYYYDGSASGNYYAKNHDTGDSKRDSGSKRTGRMIRKNILLTQNNDTNNSSHSRTFSSFKKSLTHLKLEGKLVWTRIILLSVVVGLRQNKSVKGLRNVLRNYADDDRGDSCSNLLELLYYKVIKFLLILEKGGCGLRRSCHFGESVRSRFIKERGKEEEAGSISNSTTNYLFRGRMSSQHNYYQAVIMIKYTKTSVRNCSSCSSDYFSQLIIILSWFNTDANNRNKNKATNEDNGGYSDSNYIEDLNNKGMLSKMSPCLVSRYSYCCYVLCINPKYSYEDDVVHDGRDDLLYLSESGDGGDTLEIQICPKEVVVVVVCPMISIIFYESLGKVKTNNYYVSHDLNNRAEYYRCYYYYYGDMRRKRTITFSHRSSRKCFQSIRLMTQRKCTKLGVWQKHQQHKPCNSSTLQLTRTDRNELVYSGESSQHQNMKTVLAIETNTGSSLSGNNQSCDEFCIENDKSELGIFIRSTILLSPNPFASNISQNEGSVEASHIDTRLLLSFRYLNLERNKEHQHFHGQSRTSRWLTITSSQTNTVTTTDTDTSNTLMLSMSHARILLVRVFSRRTMKDESKLSNENDPLLLSIDNNYLLLNYYDEYSCSFGCCSRDKEEDEEEGCWVGIVFVILFYDARCSLPGSGSLTRISQLTVPEKSTTKSSCHNNNNLLCVNDNPIMIGFALLIVALLLLILSSSSSSYYYRYYVSSEDEPNSKRFNCCNSINSTLLTTASVSSTTFVLKSTFSQVSSSAITSFT